MILDRQETRFPRQIEVRDDSPFGQARRLRDGLDGRIAALSVLVHIRAEREQDEARGRCQIALAYGLLP